MTGEVTRTWRLSTVRMCLPSHARGGPSSSSTASGFRPGRRRSRGDLLGGDEVPLRGAGGQLSQRFDGPGDREV